MEMLLTYIDFYKLGGVTVSIEKRYFGKSLDGAEADIYTLKNSLGTTTEITNLGGIVVSLKVQDSKGNFDDVVLGHNQIEDYLKKKIPFFGAIIGRYANRIKNGSFEINGVKYQVAKNEGENHLHGGPMGFHMVLWQAEVVKRDGNEALELSYTSKDGEEGYPGNLQVKVTYTLTEDNALIIDYYAVSDKDTIINLTNHSYFNLSGHDSGDILQHEVRLNADSFTPVDEESIPTGEITPVKGTPMDFTELTPIGLNADNKYDQIIYGKGFDHNYVLNTNGNIAEIAAEVYDKSSGRVMEVYTTKPAIQLYIGNNLDGKFVGKSGVPYEYRGGLCLETQYYPDSTSHKNFPSPILRAGEQYKHSTIYKFTTK
jgi:aldose 1-epimerase